MTGNNPTRSCRQCLANGKTADFKSEPRMKSHLATHGFGPWRCTGCPSIGHRKSTIQTHHRASGETGVAGYFDPALNDRIYLEVRECRLPHSSPWTGLTPAPQPDATALAAARATIVSQDANVPYAMAPTATVASKAVNYLNVTDEEAQAHGREVDWRSGSLTSLETSPSPPSPMYLAPAKTVLDLRSIKRQASAIASEHTSHLNEMNTAGTSIVRAKAIDFLFHELYRLRRAIHSKDPSTMIREAIGSMIDILLWHCTLLTSAKDLEMVKKNLKIIRHLKKAAKTAPLGDDRLAEPPGAFTTSTYNKQHQPVQSVRSMAANNNNGWRCRECLSNSTTVNCATAANMKSHLAIHGYGPWRCTGCGYIGRRREAITAHHRAADEAGVGSYLDPALNARINQEVEECCLPHQNPWTGQTAVPRPDPNALAAAIAALSQPPQAPRMPDPALITQAVNIAVTFADTMNEVAEDDTNYTQVQTWIGLLRHHANCIQGVQTVEDVDGDMELMVGFMQLYCNILDGTPEEIDALNNEVNDMQRLRRTMRGE
ncbi:hypothetical protein KCU71_g1096, partial [Aureobasidium melanogenum]